MNPTSPARRRWTPNTWHRPLNLVLFLCACGLFGTGWLLDDRLPRGREGRGLSLLGWGRHDWGGIHATLGYAMLGLVALHLALHAGWLTRVAARGHPWRLALGLGAGLAAIVYFLVVPIRG